MTKTNPFENPNYKSTRTMGFTKKLKSICEPMLLGESLSIEIEGMENKTIKSLLSRNFRGEFETVQCDGITWIKRMSLPK